MGARITQCARPPRWPRPSRALPPGPSADGALRGRRHPDRAGPSRTRPGPSSPPRPGRVACSAREMTLGCAVGDGFWGCAGCPWSASIRRRGDCTTRRAFGNAPTEWRPPPGLPESFPHPVLSLSHEHEPERFHARHIRQARRAARCRRAALHARTVLCRGHARRGGAALRHGSAGAGLGLAAREREATTALVAHLAELVARRLYLARGVRLALHLLHRGPPPLRACRLPPHPGRRRPPLPLPLRPPGQRRPHPHHGHAARPPTSPRPTTGRSCGRPRVGRSGRWRCWWPRSTPGRRCPRSCGDCWCHGQRPRGRPWARRLPFRRRGPPRRPR